MQEALQSPSLKPKAERQERQHPPTAVLFTLLSGRGRRVLTMT